MDDNDRAVRLEVYRSFITTGRAPSAAWQQRPDVQSALHRLAEAHQLVLWPDGRVRMAMPFSDVATPFSVTWQRGTWWANCAWDALGMGVVLHSDIDVETFCPHCDTPLHVGIRGRRLSGDDGVVHILYPAHRWWDDIVATWGSILLFRSEEHVDRPEGALVPMQTMYRLACAWYADRDHPDSTPRTVEESQTLLRSFGLDGSFWQLPDPVGQPQASG